MALEQPDLLVTTADGRPLVSVEITEQAQFGSNIEQRMARFWSAAANGVASAYIAPIEGYQIERCTASEERRIEEGRPADWEIRRFVDSIPNLRMSHVQHWKVDAVEELIERIMGSTDPSMARAQSFVRRFVLQDGPVAHVRAIPPGERLHRVGSSCFRAYLRTAQTSGSMVLSWFARCSREIPAAAFKLQSELSHLYETNGIVHATRDDRNPHLSYRNLPLGPGDGPIVHREAGVDEATLFFRFLDAALVGVPPVDIHREPFTAPGEYFDEQEVGNWFTAATTLDDVESRQSGDFLIRGSLLAAMIRESSSEAEAQLPAVDATRDFHVLKIKVSANRSLGDPYSGKLALRDVLFCRDPDAGDLKDLVRFERQRGLVFLVDLHGIAARQHTFISGEIRNACRRNGVSASESSQEMLIALLVACRAESLSKSLRSHVIFCDYIIVRRHLEDGVTCEVVAGLPALLREGLLDEAAACPRSLVQ